MSAVFWPNLVSSLVPVLLLISPGILFVFNKRKGNIINCVARVILWSLSINILATYILSALHVSVLWYAPVLVVALLIGLVKLFQSRRHRELGAAPRVALAKWGGDLMTGLLRFARNDVGKITIYFILGLAIYALFIIPFFYIQQGLPTGDSQKAIYWADQIISSSQLPDYQGAITELSRDPVDFFTPGLHTITALVIALSPAPSAVVGFFSIALGLAAVGIALAIAKLVHGKEFNWFSACLIVFFILTQYRFLRYFNEPGYHFQNIAGEVLMFGSLFLALSLIKKWRWNSSILLGVTLLALAITHQFSIFIGSFLLLPVVIIFVLNKFDWNNKTFLKQLVIPGVAVVAVVIVALSLGLYKKIPHLFTTTPHLLGLVPDLLDYPKLMGLPWLITGIAGLIILLIPAIRSWRKNSLALSLSLSVIVLFLLSQGPRIFIDIPAVRALLYLAIPLSITGAYFVSQLFNRIKNIQAMSLRIFLAGILVVSICGVGASSLVQAFSVSHTVRTDSSLSPEIKALNDSLLTDPGRGGILTDDYNRQSTSWFILSGKPMYTRASSDLSQQMSEANQSELRYKLFLDQLDFEKIFELGSLPIITDLMDKHNIEWVTGINKSSESAFAHNPSLTKDGEADDITLLKINDHSLPTIEKTSTPWLLRASTLANDIGDDEDTFKHLSASIRANRLSTPQFNSRNTFRTTTAPLIPLQFNVNDYVRILWDKEMTGQADSTLELEVRFSGNPVSLLAVTGSGKKFQITGQDATIRIPAKDAIIDADGFITITLENPTQNMVSIDLIALGLGQVP